jgi:RNA polymerase sigma-70 factor (sigma-E family)
MTTAGNDPASTREDEFLAEVYQQVTGAQAAQYAAAWDARAGLTRFRDRLQDHAPAGPEPDADQMVALLRSIPEPDADQMVALLRSIPEPDADQAVAQLYSAHYQALVRLATVLVRDAATAEEVVQDAFAAIRGGWQRLGDAEKALAYLRQAVVNRSRSVLRHRTASGANPQALPDTPAAEHETPGLLEQPAARAALRGLPERQREAIVLRYDAGLSEDQIAAAMGISRGAVNSHTARGLSALRAAVEQASSHPARPRDSDDTASRHEQP